MTDTKLESLLKATYTFKQAVDKSYAAYEKAQAELVEYMNTTQRKTAVLQMDDDVLTATAVRSERLVVDEVALKKAIGAKVYNTMIKRSLDRTKLEAAVASGEVDPVVVSQCSTIKPIKPHIRFSLKPIEDE